MRASVCVSVWDCSCYLIEDIVTTFKLLVVVVWKWDEMLNNLTSHFSLPGSEMRFWTISHLTSHFEQAHIIYHVFLIWEETLSIRIYYRYLFRVGVCVRRDVRWDPEQSHISRLTPWMWDETLSNLISHISYLISHISYLISWIWDKALSKLISHISYSWYKERPWAIAYIIEIYSTLVWQWLESRRWWTSICTSTCLGLLLLSD